MSPRPNVLLTVCLALLPGQVARNQPPDSQGEQAPPEKRAVRTDRYGDPLPAGAVARLGTVRFRHVGPVASITFSPDGTTLASAGGGYVHLWDVATGGELWRVANEGASDLAFSPNGRLLACGLERAGATGVVLREVSTGKQLRLLTAEGSTASGLAFAPDGKTLASAGSPAGGKVRLWDTATGAELRSLQGSGAVAFSPDGKILAAATKAGDVRLWDPPTGREVGRFPGEPGWTINRLAFAPDGKALAVGGSTARQGLHTALLWDVRTARQRRRFDLGAVPDPGAQKASPLFDLSPDGRLLAAPRAPGAPSSGTSRRARNGRASPPGPRHPESTGGEVWPSRPTAASWPTSIPRRRSTSGT
jgi:WD40 repeat protein